VKPCKEVADLQVSVVSTEVTLPGERELDRFPVHSGEYIIHPEITDGADGGYKDESGGTALHSAAEHGHEAAVGLLLGRNAEVDVKDSNGQTALHRAAVKGHAAVVRLLLDRGAKVAEKDREGNTALQCAEMRGHEAVVKLLQDRMTKVKVKDESSKGSGKARRWRRMQLWSLWPHLKVRTP
jgi:hypothetical protein